MGHDQRTRSKVNARRGRWRSPSRAFPKSGASVLHSRFMRSRSSTAGGCGRRPVHVETAGPYHDGENGRPFCILPLKWPAIVCHRNKWRATCRSWLEICIPKSAGALKTGCADSRRLAHSPRPSAPTAQPRNLPSRAYPNGAPSRTAFQRRFNRTPRPLRDHPGNSSQRGTCLGRAGGPSMGRHVTRLFQ